MTQIKSKPQNPKKDVKEEIHNPQFRDVDILTDQINHPKNKPDYKAIKEIEQHYLDPRSKPKNKIRTPKLPQNYLTKNKIKPPRNKPTDKPINKIEQPILEPHYTPKNKIRPPKLPPNYKTKNKIEPPKNKPTNKPNNKIEQPALKPHNTTKNKITPPKLQSNYTPKNKISPPKSVDKKVNEKQKTQPTSEPNTHSNQKSWKFINYDQNGNLLSREQKLKVATEYYTSKILPKLKELPEIQQKLNAGKSVGWRDLWHNGFSGFSAALSRQGKIVKWNEFKEFAGYKVNINQVKYRFLNYDKNGDRLTKDEKLQVAIKHFTKVILPDLKKIPKIKEKLNEGKPPTITDLNRYGHPGFIGPLSQKHPKIRYNEILRTLDFRPNVARGEYKFLNYNQKNNLRPSNVKLTLAAWHFKNKIIPTLISEKNFQVGQKITRDLLNKKGFQHFTHALINKGAKVSFNQLLIKVGLKININHKKWKFLAYDNNGNRLKRQERLQIAADYLKNTIVPDLIKKNAILKGLPPDTNLLLDYNHIDFVSALRRVNLNFSEVITKAGYPPYNMEKSNRIGQNFHFISEQIFLKHTRDNGCHSWFEIRPSEKNPQYKRNRVDNCVYVDEKVFNMSENAKKVLSNKPNIKLISVDYYLGANTVKAIDHSSRGFQAQNKLLILTPVNALKPQKVPNNIPYKNNVMMLKPEDFAEFMGYKDQTYKMFMDAVNLARIAPINKKAFEKLEDWAFKSLNDIKTTLYYSHDDFKTFLKQHKKQHLLNYVGDGSKITDWV
ncbi:MAG: hypothetical protein ACFE8T_05060 [Promethearchaeota archaeon]